MPVPRETVWPLDDHTRGKHLVLRRYLEAWLPILGSSHGRVVFIDGFAGPGEYSGGEDGSPVIAISALAEHSARERIPAVRFLFIEERRDRADHLRSVLGARFTSLPPEWQWTVVPGECAPTIVQLLNELERDGARIAPSLMMLDPFGVKGIPIDVVRQFLTHPRTEVYISFMYESFRRFDEQPEFEQHLDALFGVPRWRQTLNQPDPEVARQATYALYEQCLRNAGAKFVLHFDIYRGGGLIYSVFFATKHTLGCDRMKQAMWRAAPDGSFEFRGQRGGQMALDLGGPNYELLRQELSDFVGARGECTVDAVEKFLQSDQTLFHSGHPYRRDGLRVLESTGRIRVVRPPGARRGSFLPATLLRSVT
jgi:three-Cys-motif partner protein